MTLTLKVFAQGFPTRFWEIFYISSRYCHSRKWNVLKSENPTRTLEQNFCTLCLDEKWEIKKKKNLKHTKSETWSVYTSLCCSRVSLYYKEVSLPAADRGKGKAAETNNL